MANTTQKLIARYGYPDIKNTAFTKNLVLWDIPDDINRQIKALPNRMYCNKDLVRPLEVVLRALIKAYHARQLDIKDSIVTYDGCFNIRFIEGSKKLSTHSWGISVDFNAFRNARGTIGTFSEKFGRIWEAHGFIWGKRFKIKDYMHFELDMGKEHIWSKL